jgi:hypothetical protein
LSLSGFVDCTHFSYFVENHILQPKSLCPPPQLESTGSILRVFQVYIPKYAFLSVHSPTPILMDAHEYVLFFQNLNILCIFSARFFSGSDSVSVFWVDWFNDRSGSGNYDPDYMKARISTGR